ncbi:hypothetical protein GCM10022286_04630 [Gryllotalpicola daejeonensis]|uniref:Uncharacterized protein n=1 Tax=Gryllotalpicola daejeonensis TaxID=993087 RepID=A0ABP7ZES9_9MICO
MADALLLFRREQVSGYVPEEPHGRLGRQRLNGRHVDDGLASRDRGADGSGIREIYARPSAQRDALAPAPAKYGDHVTPDHSGTSGDRDFECACHAFIDDTPRRNVSR